MNTTGSVERQLQIAPLNASSANELAKIQNAFAETSPGYSLDYFHDVTQIDPSTRAQVVFIQNGRDIAFVDEENSECSVGDLVLLRPGQKFDCREPLCALVFQLPESEALPDELPTFIRPDHDTKISNQPGGCATASDGYRRILLTWQHNVGPYLYKSLNAHRVLINDSLTHYHPVGIGFDEFYLVQDATETGRLLISYEIDLIEQPGTVRPEQIDDIFAVHNLSKGDLVYIPKGTIHRGLGGVLAQVITIPGFIPGAEIGVDHHLRAINDRLGLERESALPFNMEASHAPVIN